MLLERSRKKGHTGRGFARFSRWGVDQNQITGFLMPEADHEIKSFSTFCLPRDFSVLSCQKLNVYYEEIIANVSRTNCLYENKLPSQR